MAEVCVPNIKSRAAGSPLGQLDVFKPQKSSSMLSPGVAWAQLELDDFARAAVLGPAVGVTVPNRYSLAEGRLIAPNPRVPPLGPRAFSVSVVN